MKLKRTTYEILQYLSTIDEIFAYSGDNVFIMREMSGSSFTEVEVKDFFNEQVIIRSLPKFLRLFSFPKPGKTDSNDVESFQEWTLEDHLNTKTGHVERQMLLKQGNHIVKVSQGQQRLMEYHKVKHRFDEIKMGESVTFQLTRAQYKQIVSDCSLLDLDMITFTSLDEHKIQIYLSKKDSVTNTDYSTDTIECDHEHFPTKVTIMLNTFSLIDATDHQIEFGVCQLSEDHVVPVVKVKSFYTSETVVQRVIRGIRGDK